MRVKKTLINSIYAILSYILIAVLALILRRYFLQYLPTEYLGYEGLFSDIFAILSIGNLGIGSIILYRMFPAINANDEKTITKLMAVYRLLYAIVGAGIALVGIILLPLLPYIIKGNTLRWSYVYMVYLLQLVVALCSYFLAYKRVMLEATMREAEATKIETMCTLCSTIVKIVVILATQNYILYLVVGVLNNIISNLFVVRKVNRDYPYIKNPVKITRSDIRELGIGKDLKNNVVQKICSAIYGGTDNILISSMIGIAEAGLRSNYALLTGHFSNMMTKMLNPFQISIGNYVHSDDQSRALSMFHMFDRIGFFIGSFVSVSFFVLFNPFIELIFGGKFLLSSLYVLFFAVNQYITYNHKFLCFYRGAFGKYEIDKWFTAIAAILNLVFSIALAKPFGIAGIMLGTVIGHMGFWIGRIKVVYSEYVEEPVIKYILRQLFNTLLCAGEMVLTYYICSMTSNNVLGFILKMFICLIVPNAINFILFSRTNSMKMIFEYLGKSREALSRKKKQDA